MLHSKCTDIVLMTHCTTFKGDVVSLTHFAKYVEKMHQDRDKLFETEYSVSRLLLNNSLYFL